MAPQEIKIMLWNAQSIFGVGTLGEFQKAVEELNPNIICLVETWLSPNRNFKLKGFEVFRKDRDCNGGGVAILSRLEMEAKILNLGSYNNSNYEHLGISVIFNNNPLNIINLYNPHGNSSSEELNYYLSRVQGKVLLCGDFNARHPIWDTYGTNAAGNDLYNFISTSRNLSLLTPQNLGTRKNLRGNGDSTIDLFIGDSNFIPVSYVTRCTETGGSDHYPTLLQLKGKVKWNPIKFRGRWKIEPCLWAEWLNKMAKENFIPTGNIERDINTLSNNLIKIGKNTFVTTNGIYSVKHYASWWNKECSIAR